MLPCTTIIMYDFDRLKGVPVEFNNIISTEGKRVLQARLQDMCETIQSLKSAFGGVILHVTVPVRDKLGNVKQLEHEPIALEVPYYLSSREIDYVKSIDKHLVCVM
jgi:hypothetical protein